MPARSPRRPRVDHAGVHHLRCPRTLRALVRGAALTPDLLLYDLGAGPGTITAALAGSGARVVAVERDPRFAEQLRRRFAEQPHVRVLERDLREVAIPRRARVVASIPFATSGAVAARLLDPAGPLSAGADLIVEHGFARRLSSRRPRSAQAAWRSARHELRVVRAVPRAAFAPPPAVNAALLRIRPRAPLDGAAERRLRALLAAAYSGRHRHAAAVARQCAGRTAGPRLLRAAGIALDADPLTVPAAAWARVARGPEAR